MSTTSRPLFHVGVCLVVVFFLSPALRAGDDKDENLTLLARKINEIIDKQWNVRNLPAAERTSDLEFLRRVSLDIIGRIATVEEVREFEKDARPDKRARLIDRLLDSKDYARHWADLWTSWLLTPSGNPLMHEQKRMFPEAPTRFCFGPKEPYLGLPRFDSSLQRAQLHAWLEQQFSKNVSHKELVEKLLTAQGKADENGAVNFFLAHLGDATPKQKIEVEGQFDMVPLTMRFSRVFLGYRVQPIPYISQENHTGWGQKHFWGMNCFFRQVERVGAVVFELRDNEKLNPGNVVFYYNRKEVVFSTRPVFIGGRYDPRLPKSRRHQLAELLVGHPHFSKVYVNRLWGHFFRRGLNEFSEVDDFGEFNTVRYPDLLAHLAEDFREGGRHDSKLLIRWICNSHAYQVKCASTWGQVPLKLMTPEQLFESLLTAAQPGLAKDDRQKLREKCLQHFFVYLGDVEADEITYNRACNERHLQDLAAMINLKEMQEVIFSKITGTLPRALKKETSFEILDELTLAALNRHPSAKEIERYNKEVEELKKNGDKNTLALWQDIFWSLLNSNEFIFNH